MVRRVVVEKLLRFYIANNPAYRGVTLDAERLASLPEEGVPGGMRTIPEQLEEAVESQERQEERETADVVQEEEALDGIVRDSFVPVEEDTNLIRDEIQAALTGTTASNPLPWPPQQPRPFDEYNTPYLLSSLFPHLFPLGKADPTNLARLSPVPEKVAFEHLVRYPDGRFAKDSAFVFWCFNRLTRHKAYKYATFYIRNRLMGNNLDELRSDPQALAQHIGKGSGTSLLALF